MAAGTLAIMDMTGFKFRSMKILGKVISESEAGKGDEIELLWREDWLQSYMEQQVSVVMGGDWRGMMRTRQ